MMQLKYVEDLTLRDNYIVLTNKSQEIMNRNYQLSINTLTEDDIISGMSYQFLDTLDLKIHYIISKIDRLKQNIDSKELAFNLIYEILEDSKIFSISEGTLESIINQMNKSSYAFYPYNTFDEFVKCNDLKFYIAKDQLNILIDDENTTIFEKIIIIYEKFRDKEYMYLDEFIIYLIKRLNIIKKEVKK